MAEVEIDNVEAGPSGGPGGVNADDDLSPGHERTLGKTGEQTGSRARSKRSGCNGLRQFSCRCWIVHLRSDAIFPGGGWGWGHQVGLMMQSWNQLGVLRVAFLIWWISWMDGVWCPGMGVEQISKATITLDGSASIATPGCWPSGGAGGTNP